MLDIGLGTGYLSSSAGAKQKRQDAKAIEELISDQVEHDPIKHLRILEYMASNIVASAWITTGTSLSQ